MAPKRPGEFSDTRTKKFYRTDTSTMDGDTAMPFASRRRGGFRWSNARSGWVPNYTGSHGPRTSTYRRNGNYKRRLTGPYNLLSNSQITRHQNPVFPVPEVKQLDLVFGTSAVPIPIPAAGVFFTTAGPVYSLNQILQGTINNQRIGASVTILSVSFRLDFDINTTVPTTSSFRHVIVWDRQPNNYTTAPIITDILTTATLTSFLAFDNLDRFVVLRNQLLTVSENGQETQFTEGFVKINMKSRYLNTASTEPNSGALLAFFISDQTTNPPTVNGNYRVRFKDN